MGLTHAYQHPYRKSVCRQNTSACSVSELWKHVGHCEDLIYRINSRLPLKKIILFLFLYFCKSRQGNFCRTLHYVQTHTLVQLSKRLYLSTQERFKFHVNDGSARISVQYRHSIPGVLIIFLLFQLLMEVKTALVQNYELNRIALYSSLVKLCATANLSYKHCLLFFIIMNMNHRTVSEKRCKWLQEVTNSTLHQ